LIKHLIEEANHGMIWLCYTVDVKSHIQFMCETRDFWHHRNKPSNTKLSRVEPRYFKPLA